MKKDQDKKMLELCVQDIAGNGWKDFSFVRVSENNDIPLSQFYDQFQNRSDIPQAVIRHVDHEMLEELEGEAFEGATPREILFEILMTRFEVAASYKPFIRTLWQEWPADMFSAFMVASQGVGSMGWILDRAGLNGTGLKGIMRLQGLTILYLWTVKEWLDDDSEDMGKTMASLDQGLDRIERIAKAMKL